MAENNVELVPLTADENNSSPPRDTETDATLRSGGATALGSMPFVPTLMKYLFFLGVSSTLFYAVISRGKYDGDTAPIPSRPNLNANATARPWGKDSETSVGRPFPTAVVHVGPTKTGTSSIQSALSKPEYLRALAADNYVVPYSARKHMMLTSCARDRTSKKCRGRDGVWNSTVQSFRHSRKVERTNAIFSCELLDNFQTPSDWDALEEMLGGYRLHVVVVYRRFYDWLHSGYGQTRKPFYDWSSRKIKKWTERVEWEFDNTNIVSWLQGDHVDMLYDSYYSVAVYHNYARRYGDDNVSLLNFHDGDIVENFFCDDEGLRSPSACELRRSGEIPQGFTNTGVPTVYDELAIAAYDKGLLAPSSTNSTRTRGRDLKGRTKARTDENSVVTRPEAREAIRYHQEVVMNRTSEDFTRICLPTETMNRIHQLSLEAERMLTPEFFNSTRGEHALQSDFESRSHAMFCSVDVDSVLNESTWKEFFLGLVEIGTNGNGINKEEGDQ